MTKNLVRMTKAELMSEIKRIREEHQETEKVIE